MLTCCVLYSKDGYKLRVTDVPRRILMLQWFFCEIAHLIASGSHHRLCCQMPEWTWYVGWGRYHPGEPLYDPDCPDYLEHSLGGLAWRLMNWLETYGYRKEKLICELPLTLEQVKEYFPDSRVEFLENDEGNEIIDPEPITEEPGDDAMRIPRHRYRLRRLRRHKLML